MLKHRIALTLLLASSMWGIADASIITYESTSLGGTAWRYDYTLANDSLEVPVEEFTIYFGSDTFQNLRSPIGPAAWDVIAVEPDLALPADGFFDGLALVGALLPGGIQEGFSIEFDFLGAGAPGSQFFEFLTASLDVLDTGFTQLARPTTPVPEPTSWLLLVSGSALVALRRFRQRMLS